MNQSRLKGLEQVLPQDTLVRGGVLAEYTTIKVGGAAGLMMEARDAQEVAAALAAARQHGVPALIIGNGSNLLVADEGF